MFESIYSFIESTISVLRNYTEDNTLILNEKIETVSDDAINELIMEVQNDIKIEKLEKRYKKLVEDIEIFNKKEDEDEEEDNNNNEGAVAVLA